MSIGDVAEELSRIADGLPSASLIRAADGLGQAVELLTHSAEGTASPELPEAIRQLTAEQQHVIHIRQAVEAARQAVRRYREQITAPNRGVDQPAVSSTSTGGDTLPASCEALALVGVNNATQSGGLRYAGQDGDWYSKGGRVNDHGVQYVYFGNGHDFPADSEIPLTDVEQAMGELLTNGGLRPECVIWQPAE
jgi:hypothetical protein